MDNETMTALRWMMLENIATLAICGATVVGLYYLGAGGHSFWALLMLMNINTPKIKTQTSE